MLNRIKRIRGHAGHARFLAETSEELVGTIERQRDIPSPYAYSPDHTVYEWNDRHVIVVETSHRCYDVFEVPPSICCCRVGDGFHDAEPEVPAVCMPVEALQD